MKIIWIITISLTLFLFGCSKENEAQEETAKNITIFFVNDVHGHIDNFSKLKHIVDAERDKTNVIVTSNGDLFSGNPVVDNYIEKGYPIIDLMNKTGFDIAVVGNHEYDYGIKTLAERMDQSAFPWVCANVDVGNSGLPQIPAYSTLSSGGLKITFLGLVETGGSKQSIIPSTHPWKVQDLTFEHAKNIIKNFMHTKNDEDADLLIAISHLGYISYGDIMGDFQLAQENSFFDLIIGGHSHAIIDTTIHNIPVFQSGEYLNHLGKIELSVQHKSIQSIHFSLIDLNEYNHYDNELQALIDSYNDRPELKEVIGSSNHQHSKTETGCFYTDVLRQFLDVDVSFQNTGGIRTILEPGDITRRDIYEIEPFNNGTVIYEMSVEEIKHFLVGSGSGFYYSGIRIQKVGNDVQIKDLHDRIIPDNYILKVGLNDYIPAVHSFYFPENGVVQPLTASESIIAYLTSVTTPVDYSGYNNYFRY